MTAYSQSWFSAPQHICPAHAIGSEEMSLTQFLSFSKDAPVRSVHTHFAGASHPTQGHALKEHSLFLIATSPFSLFLKYSSLSRTWPVLEEAHGTALFRSQALDSLDLPLNGCEDGAFSLFSFCTCKLITIMTSLLIGHKPTQDMIWAFYHNWGGKVYDFFNDNSLFTDP